MDFVALQQIDSKHMKNRKMHSIWHSLRNTIVWENRSTDERRLQKYNSRYEPFDKRFDKYLGDRRCSL